MWEAAVERGMRAPAPGVEERATSCDEEGGQNQNIIRCMYYSSTLCDDVAYSLSTTTVKDVSGSGEVLKYNPIKSLEKQIAEAIIFPCGIDCTRACTRVA